MSILKKINIHQRSSLLLSDVYHLFHVDLWFHPFSSICSLSFTHFQSHRFSDAKLSSPNTQAALISVNHILRSYSLSLSPGPTFPFQADLPLTWTRCYSSDADRCVSRRFDTICKPFENTAKFSKSFGESVLRIVLDTFQLYLTCFPQQCNEVDKDYWCCFKTRKVKFREIKYLPPGSMAS